MQATINHIMINTSLKSSYIIPIYPYFSNKSFVIHIEIYNEIILTLLF